MAVVAIGEMLGLEDAGNSGSPHPLVLGGHLLRSVEPLCSPELCVPPPIAIVKHHAGNPAWTSHGRHQAIYHSATTYTAILIIT